MVTLTKEWLLKERAHWQRAAKNTPIPQGFLLRVATCDLALQGLEESVRSEADERIRIAELNALAARGAALEEAAKVCEEWRFPPENYEAADRWNRVGGYMNAIAGATDACAAAIRALQSPARVAEGGAMKYSPDEHDGKVPESPAEEQPGEVVAMVKRLREVADRLNKATEGYPTSVPTLGMLLNDAAALIEKLGQRVNQLERVLELYCPNHSLLSASDLDISPPPPERP